MSPNREDSYRRGRGERSRAHLFEQSIQFSVEIFDFFLSRIDVDVLEVEQMFRFENFAFQQLNQIVSSNLL